MKPALYVIVDGDWPTFDAHETNAAYERYGILPGAFYHDETQTVYCSESTFRAALAETMRPGGPAGLLEHECGHAWLGDRADHPTAILAGSMHALGVLCDTRAFTRLLRWRWNRETHGPFTTWLADAALDWHNGALKALPAPK